jgi:hypothetical protein
MFALSQKWGAGKVSPLRVDRLRRRFEWLVNIDQRVMYSELIYKVLWNETRRQDASFGGLWDVDDELTKVVATRLHDLSIRAFDWGDAVAADDRTAALQTLCPSVDPDQTNAPPLDGELQRALRAHGASHFILWCTTAQQVSVTAFNAAANLGWPGRLSNSLDAPPEPEAASF